jgi:acyl carrier protein|tara:strand:- start:2273 stop:2512 length:240 start_codon:yes stop_codon:yes gene_type:complete
MTIKFTIEDILHIVERQLDLERDTIKVGDDLQEQHGADSLDLVEIVMELEEQLGVEIHDDDIVALKLHDTDNLIKYLLP